MGDPVRVLIATADTGGGHRAMSNALASAFARHHPGAAAVQIENVFSVAPRTVFEHVTDLYGTCIRLAPWLYGSAYHLSNRPRAYRTLNATQRNLTRKLAKLIDASRPDVVVSTHPLANRSLLDAVAANGRRIPVVASVSELVTVHRSWAEPGLHLLNTATTESYQAVLRWGAPRHAVRCVGLPVDERFALAERDPAEVRAELGLDPGRFTTLLVGGSEGAGGIESIVRALQEVDLPIQLVVVCGRNRALQARLGRRSLRTPAKVLGFVQTMPDLMRAADVVVTKGGPQTIVEALVVGRPVVLTQTLPGQEEGNGAFVESRGVGFGPGPVRRVVENVGLLARDAELRAAMTRNAVRHGRPRAAAELAAMILRAAEAR
jgi:1,2-diacylglycerol 3-beta-galactosyltransferase